MARVAILGTQRTGKTVLMTVLAQKFRRNETGIQFIPLTQETASFVASNWECLKRSDWPPSTREGVMTRLRWEVKAYEFPPCNLQFHDISGQEFRGLFSTDQQPKRLKAIADHVRSSEVVVFLVNLDDFIGREDEEHRKVSELALLNALRFANASANPRRCALVFTQIDLYASQKKKHGSWDNVARQFLPNVYSEFIEAGNAALLAVASVSNVVADANAGPRGRLVPATHWQSVGLEELVHWICKSASEVDIEKLQMPRSHAPPPVIVPEPDIDFRKKPGCMPLILAIFLTVTCWCCRMVWYTAW